MPEQNFDLASNLRLEVEDWAGLVNLVQNPDGVLGPWGWISPAPGGMLSTFNGIRCSAPGGGPSWFYTEPLPITPSSYVAASWLPGIVNSNNLDPGYYKASIEWLDSAGVLLSSATPTGYLQGSNGSGTSRVVYGPYQAPANAHGCRLRIDHYNDTSAGNPNADVRATINEVSVAADPASAPLANLPYLPVTYTDILGGTNNIKVKREAFNVGTLTATILDASLHPAQEDMLRPGRRIKLSSYYEDGVSLPRWLPLFTGRISNAQVTYDLRNPDPTKRVRIDLSANDATEALANIKRSEGVGTIPALPYVLEGTGVPFKCDDITAQVKTATIVSRNDNASAIDQIGITRDTVLGRAFVSTSGVMEVWSTWPAGFVTYDEDRYSGLDIGYDTDQCINEVTIKFLRLNPGTGETEEILYGPYRDENSVAQWGPRSSTFTIHGLSEETADIPNLAAAILAANATPRVRVLGMSVGVRRISYPDQFLATRDLYHPMRVINADQNIDQNVFLTSMEHTITAKTAGSTWDLHLGFNAEGLVSAPSFTPSPETGAGGKTIGQLLRPVGEITMYGGATAPEGWLKCDGASKLVADYADLFAAIGYTFGGSGANFNVPNFTDRFPIGAGTKALGTSGGAATKTLVEANLPPHAHAGAPLVLATSSAVGSDTARVARGTAAGAGGISPVQGSTGVGAGTSTPVDVMPPWRAINFIIRAV